MAYFDQNNRGDDRRSFGPRRDFGGRGGQDRRMYAAVCDKCGRNCQVPFEPDGSKPVYCSDCFEKREGSFGPKRSNFGGGRPVNDKSTEILVSINSKLARILELMEAGKKPKEKVKKEKVK